MKKNVLLISSIVASCTAATIAMAACNKRKIKKLAASVDALEDAYVDLLFEVAFIEDAAKDNENYENSKEDAAK